MGTHDKDIAPAESGRFGEQAQLPVALRENAVDRRVDIARALHMHAAVVEVGDTDARVLVNLPVEADTRLVGSRRPNTVVDQLQLLRLAATR